MSSLRNLYASKIQNLWPHARRGFFRSKNSVSYILRIPNLDFCVLKTQKHLVFKSRASGAGARRGFFRAQNSDFLFFEYIKERFLRGPPGPKVSENDGRVLKNGGPRNSDLAATGSYRQLPATSGSDVDPAAQSHPSTRAGGQDDVS